MKKLVLSVAIILGSLSTVSATTSSLISNPVMKSLTVTYEFKEIKVEELPAAIKDAFKAAYPEGAINKAYVNEDKEYKIEVKIGEKEGYLYADESGKWIQM